MSVSTYAELVTACENWLHRDGLDNRIPEFITFGEARIAREVQCRQMEASTTIAAAATVALPDDFVSIKAIRLTGSSIGWLDYMTPDEFFNTTPSSSSCQNKKYTIFGGLVFPAIPTSSVQLWYYKKMLALSSSLNTLFTVNPDLYLYGAMAAAQPFLKNITQMPMWESLFAQVRDSVNLIDKKGRYPAGMAVKSA